MIIREASEGDLSEVLDLYTFLKHEPKPAIDPKIQDIWKTVLEDANHHLIVGVEHNRIITSCVALIIPNLTHSQQPYMLIENVITHPDHRKNGYASQILDAAKDIACEQGCYKMMLMTGSKEDATLRFYERAGYNRNDKTAFVQWL